MARCGTALHKNEFKVQDTTGEFRYCSTAPITTLLKYCHSLSVTSLRSQVRSACGASPRRTAIQHIVKQSRVILLYCTNEASCRRRITPSPHCVALKQHLASCIPSRMFTRVCIASKHAQLNASELYVRGEDAKSTSKL